MALIPKAVLDQLTASPNDFDCIPRGTQVELYIEKLRERGISQFTAMDLVEIFATAAMKSPRSGKKITLSRRKATEYLDKLVASGKLARSGDLYSTDLT